MAVVRPGSGGDAMLACVRARAGSKPAREPSGAGGQRAQHARWRAALPRSGPTRPATSNRCTPRGGAHPAPCARGAHGIFFRIWRPDQSGNVQFPIIGRWATPSNFFRSLIGIRSY